MYALMHEKKLAFAVPGAAPDGLRNRPRTIGLLQLSQDGKLAFVSDEEADSIFVISIPEKKIVRTFKVAAASGPDPVMAYALP